jgi:uncharacterized metal-binding protein YceD (DUF177 family)
VAGGTGVQGQVVVFTDRRLLIDVDTLTAEGWAFDDVIAAEHVTALLHQHSPSDLEALTSLRVRLRAYKAGEGLRMDGSVSGHLNRPCGRCLQPAPLAVALKLGLTLFAAKSPGDTHEGSTNGGARTSGGTPRRARGREEDASMTVQDFDDLDTATYEAGEVDVLQILREQVLLEVPITHLCREDCRGLCQRCGADWNLGACGCGREFGDPRLAVLATIKVN